MTFVAAKHGDHFAYVPPDAIGVLVVAHGTRSADEPAKTTARRLLGHWTEFAVAHNLIVIAPVFDDARFGNRGGGGYGGYRGLFGKYMAADDFVLSLVAGYREQHRFSAKHFMLYGYSAGAQFAVRFAVKHPRKLAYVVVGAPGRYSYPATDTPWPYGAGPLSRTVKWDEGAVKQHVLVTPDLLNYAFAAGKMTVIVGDQDTAAQPKRPAHVGRTRVALAQSWTAKMNQSTWRQWQTLVGEDPAPNDLVQLRIVPGVGHSSAALVPHAISAFLAAAGR